jgi:hypothetical protein
MRKIFLLMLLFMIFLSTVVDASDEFCASLRNMKGEVVIERIRTGPDSSVGIIFVDNSRMSLGPNSRLDLKKFVFKPNEGKFSMVNKLSKGTASFVSGKMTKLSPESVVLETPSSTIGVRGTTFNVKVND